ncbi:MAG: hypothetical protein JJ913_15100 [Rhizobiaceae bacterium]|nr:hypothetical protein [Rhizobiaceae bacterium]
MIRAGLFSAVAALALAAAASPAVAWEQLDLGTNSAGQPTYAPEGQLPKFKDLPGVGFGASQGARSGECAESRVYSENFSNFGTPGTMTECNFGRFSLRTYRSNNNNAAGTGYNPFPVPEPLRQAGPPPGSGGYAPTLKW